MKILLSRRTIVEFLLIALLLLPQISFLWFTFFGSFFNFNNYYFYIYLSIIALSVSYSRIIKFSSLNFFLLFAFCLLATLFSHIRNGGQDGVFEFLRSISGYYFFVFLGWLLYQIYYKKGDVNRILRLIVRIAGLIAIVNIIHFIILQTDNYTHHEWSMTFNRYNVVVDYLLKLNKTFYDYIIISAQYNEVGFIRPVGFFFDTHSQYYLPLGASVILIFGNNISRNKWIYLLVFSISILFSGIKTAYMSIVLMFMISLFLSGKTVMVFKRSLPILILLIIVFRDNILHLILGEGMWKILFQLFQHIVVLPIRILNFDVVSFMLGGIPYLRNDVAFYSEVFWVTVIFYIGIVGVLIYLVPIRLFKYIRFDEIKIGTYIYIMFCFSLTHYSVYMIGINNVLSAIPFMYYFGLLEKMKINKIEESIS